MARKKFQLDIVRWSGLGGGAILAKVLNKPLANLDPKLRSGAKVAAGVAAGMLVKKQPLIGAIGDGLIATGIGELIGSFIPVLAGDEDFDTLGQNEYSYMATEDMVDEGVEGAEDDESLTG